jgi:hypothetical protein
MESDDRIHSSDFAPFAGDHAEVGAGTRGNPEMRYFRWMKIFVDRA